MAAPYLDTRLCNFVRNISTNISALGRRTYLKLGELSFLFIVYNITIFWLCPLHSFGFYFLLPDSAHTLYTKTVIHLSVGESGGYLVLHLGE